MLLLSAMVLMAPLAQAQEGRQGPAERRTERLEKMTEQLGLTTEQAARIKAIDEEHEVKRAELRSIEDEGARRNAMRELGRAQREAFQAVLTPEQRQKAEALRAERMEARRNAANVTPEERAAKRTRWMTEELDLSEDQASDVQELMLRQLRKKEALMTMENEHERKQALQQVQRAQEEGLKAILSPEQRERWEALKAERKERSSKHGQRGEQRP